jgi:hypothetical protein
MLVKKQGIRSAIDEYVADNPGGHDVTAFVLTRIGEAVFASYVRSAHKGDADAGKKELGALIKELLFEKHPSTKQLETVKVDFKKWPELSGWVTSYTTYDIQ